MMTTRTIATMTIKGDKMSEFNNWMNLVNMEIERLTGGLSSDDLTDACYCDWFDSGATPAEMAGIALEAEGFYPAMGEW